MRNLVLVIFISLLSINSLFAQKREHTRVIDVYKRQVVDHGPMSAGRHRSGPEGRREGGGTMRFSCLEIGGGAISER